MGEKEKRDRVKSFDLSEPQKQLSQPQSKYTFRIGTAQ